MGRSRKNSHRKRKKKSSENKKQRKLKHLRNYKSKLKEHIFADRRRYSYSGRDSPASTSKRNEMDANYDHNRRWQKVEENTAIIAEQQSGEEEQFKLVSYNILAQDLLEEHMHLYLNIPRDLLSWEKRRRNLQKEIQKLNPDILCLQEMQYNHLKYFVKILKANRRLEYIYKKKTGCRTDGCAIIYDSDKFHLTEEQGVEYYTESIRNLDRPNVALLAKFKVKKDPCKEFVVATTHLLYNPRRDDVRCAQINVLQTALTFFSYQNGVQLPVILTGDFNAETNSMAYLVLQQLRHLYSNTGDKLTNLKLNPLQFGCNTASTFQDKWITVDYILYGEGSDNRKVVVDKVYELVPIDFLEKRGLIPNKFLGSDHYCLAITFSIK